MFGRTYGSCLSSCSSISTIMTYCSASTSVGSLVSFNLLPNRTSCRLSLLINSSQALLLRVRYPRIPEKQGGLDAAGFMTRGSWYIISVRTLMNHSTSLTVDKLLSHHP